MIKSRNFIIKGSERASALLLRWRSYRVVALDGINKFKDASYCRLSFVVCFRTCGSPCISPALYIWTASASPMWPTSLHLWCKHLDSSSLYSSWYQPFLFSLDCNYQPSLRQSSHKFMSGDFVPISSWVQSVMLDIDLSFCSLSFAFTACFFGLLGKILLLARYFR